MTEFLSGGGGGDMVGGGGRRGEEARGDVEIKLSTFEGRGRGALPKLSNCKQGGGRVQILVIL